MRISVPPGDVPVESVTDLSFEFAWKRLLGYWMWGSGVGSWYQAVMSADSRYGRAWKGVSSEVSGSQLNFMYLRLGMPARVWSVSSALR